MRCARERVRRVPLGAVRQVPGPQGGGEGRVGVRVGDRKRWSALCPHWLLETGGWAVWGAHPFPPLPMGAINHIILANQKNRSQVTPQMDVKAYGCPAAPSFQLKDWTGCHLSSLVLQASELAKLCEKE